ncbi:hypothetical protein AB0F77_40380 [Streptomyces sp. NPDC026672]|uniref:hypothetical protein n=1 Tax=Actinomycetes TaxID=1760 RepID=UPI0033ED9501
MSDLTTEHALAQARTELAQLRAGLAVGLTPEQSARLQGFSADELEADAQAFAAELGLVAPAIRSGGDRGVDVSGHTAGSVAAGADLYRQRHGSPDDERRPAPTDGRNPFATNTYSVENN